MNETRIAVVKHAFQFLDDQKAGKISFDKLTKIYNSAAHPRVRTREKKAETIFNDLINCLGPLSVNGFVFERAFIAYYSDINGCLASEKDDYFVDMVLKTWGLNTDKAFVSAARVAEIEDIIFEKIR